MLIQVTQEDIDSGARQSCSHCPVANAISRILNLNYTLIGVTPTYFRNRETNTVYGFPKIVGDFIHRYDRYQQVEPFEFELKGI